MDLSTLLRNVLRYDLLSRIATEYKENQNDVKNFVTAIHKYKKELSLMARQYSSLLEHVNYLSSICQKS